MYARLAADVGHDFILPPAFWPAFFESPRDAAQKRAQRAPRQDEILTRLSTVLDGPHLGVTRRPPLVGVKRLKA